MKYSLALFLALLLTLSAGCGILPEVKEETAGWSANKLYSAARDSMSDGEWSKAVKYFEVLEARYPYGRYAQQAQLEVAYAYYKDNEAASAIAACDRFIKLHPDHANVDYAYYLKGLTNFNDDLGIFGILGKQDMTERDPKAAREAFEAFKELVVKFPDSKYAKDSEARMKYLVNALASHEVHVARYYMKRGAYVAAVNRAQNALKEYPQAPATEEAVLIMVQAYDALGITDLRDDASRIMQKNFPNSKYLAGNQAKGDAWWKIWKLF